MLLSKNPLRLNQDIPEGAAITLRHVEELIAFPTNMYLIRVSGETVVSLLNHSVEAWIGTGWFLQVSGLTFDHNPDSTSVSNVRLEDGTPVKPHEHYKMVVNDFLLNPRFGQDGYTMLSRDMLISDKSVDLKALLIKQLSRINQITPTLQKRICNPLRPDNCRSHKTD